MECSYEVGQLVRVCQKGSKARRRGLIATINTWQSSRTVDVVYIGPVFQVKKRNKLEFAAQFGFEAVEFQATSESDEESEVSLDRLSAMLSFEVETDPGVEGEHSQNVALSQAILGSLKDSRVDPKRSEACALELVQVGVQRIQQLAEAKDFEAAVEEVVLTISSLCTFAVGSAVCNVPLELDEKQRSKPSVLGTVMTLDDGEAELLLESDDELTVDTCSLIPVPLKERFVKAYADLLLQGIYFLLKQEQGTLKMAWRWASVVVRLYAQGLDKTTDELLDASIPCVDKEMAFQAHMYKARALILGLKFNAAAASVRASVFLKPRDKTARQMVTIIKQRKKRQQVENKKLVKEIARWVQHSMEESKRFEGKSDE